MDFGQVMLKPYVDKQPSCGEVGLCNKCGHYNSYHSVCNCANKILVPLPAPAGVTKPEDGLEELYNELGNMKWLRKKEGWNEAIECVRRYIKESNEY